MYYHRGPRRLFWFILGGAAATFWLKAKEKDRCLVEWSDERPQWWWSSRKGRLEQGGSEGWKEERERIAKIGSQATDTAADVSEAALDTILSTVEALKSKLAERRELHPKPDPAHRSEPEPSHRV